MQQPTDMSQVSSDLDIVATYDHMLNDWLSKLPHSIPGRIRLLKERIIRAFAAELLLARVCVTSRIDDASDQHDTEVQHAASTTAGDASPPGSLRRSAARASNSDIATGEAGISGSERPDEGVVRAYDTLSTLTTVNSRKTLSQTASSMLSHWQLGMDPDSYDWQRSVQTWESDTSRASTPRPRSRRKASYTHSVGSLTPAPTSSAASAAPVRETASQPQNELVRTQLNSSQTVEDPLPMSQVERGIFGGREAGRKGGERERKRRRAAGF